MKHFSYYAIGGITVPCLRPGRLLLVLALVLMAACQGSATARFDQAVRWHRSGKTVEAVSQLTRMAKAGDANAQAYLGSMYASGDGVARDMSLAVKWETLAAKQGHVLAQYNLAILLVRSRGDTSYLARAATWFQAAAEAGLPEAQLHMGLLHEKGWGVIRCPQEASKWYYRAGTTFLSQNNVKMAIRARDDIRRLLPKGHLATQLTDEIFLHGSGK